MSVPFVVIVVLALGLVAAAGSILVAARLASQLKDAQARLLSEVVAREKAAKLLEEQEGAKARLLEAHETEGERLAREREADKARMAEEHAAETARLIEARSASEAQLKESFEAAKARLVEAHEATKAHLIESHEAATARLVEARTALSARALAAETALEKARAEIDSRASEIAGVRETVARAEGAAKAAEAELRRTLELLETSRREAQAQEERAARLEKQLFDLVASSKLEKQLLDTLGATQASGVDLQRDLQRAESEVWRERTSKESAILEARALREDVKRTQIRLSGEIARREELARQWSEALLAGRDVVVEAPASRAETLEALAKAMAPPLPVEASAPLSMAARSMRPRGMPGKPVAAPVEEPKPISGWWCQICGRGGTQLATACKHQWKDNQMLEKLITGAAAGSGSTR